MYSRSLLVGGFDFEQCDVHTLTCVCGHAHTQASVHLELEVTYCRMPKIRYLTDKKMSYPVQVADVTSIYIAKM